MRRVAWWSLPILLAACGGGDGGGTGGVPVSVVPAPTPPASPSPSPSPSPSSSPTPTTWSAQVDALFTEKPDVAACRPGMLSQKTLADMLSALNTIRALHRLPAVSLSSADQNAATQAALMMAANGQLSHTPPTSWKCYSAAGAAGAGSSNLYGGTISPYLGFTNDEGYLAGWMTEVSNLVADSVGHRRWLLNPFLGTVAYGRVAGLVDGNSRTDAAALKVFNNAGQPTAVSGLPPFVGYPYGDYPAKYFDTRALLSFSVIADAASSGGNRAVDFSRATIAVTGPSGALAVSKQAADNDGFGIPNNLQWAVAGLQAGMTYDVAIGGVAVRGVATSYTYRFRIV